MNLRPANMTLAEAEARAESHNAWLAYQGALDYVAKHRIVGPVADRYIARRLADYKAAKAAIAFTK